MNESLRPSPKDAIIEAAFDVLAEAPGASLADIAARAGVGRATLHRHFAGREDLIRTLALIAIEEMDAAADAACEGVESHGEALRRTLAAIIPLGDRHWFLSREPVDDDPVIAREFERLMRETGELIEAAKSEGVFDEAAPTAWIAQAYDHLIFAAWESVKAGEATHSQAADLAWRTLTIGVGRN
ncbi:MAG: helix-turn-helix domain-containing protein [Pseudomonadota bacterium]